MVKSKIGFFSLLAIIGLLVVIYLDSKDFNFSCHDLLVEFHGLIFDLFVFGILIAIYETISNKRDRIIRYNEEIDDYRFWKSEEANFRIRGLLNRLIKLKVSKVNLSHCYISGCPTTDKMNDWNFSGAYLLKSYFLSIDLSNSFFYQSELTNIDFQNTNLTNVKFNAALFNDCEFQNCIFDNTDLTHAYIKENNWFDILAKNSNIGVDSLKNRYIISDNTVLINSQYYYQIIRKDSNSKKAETREKLFLDSIEYLKKYGLKNVL